MDIQKIENYLDTIEALCEKVRQEINDGRPRVRVTTSQSDSGVVVRQNGSVIAGNPRPQKHQTMCPQTLDFASRIINDPSWPVAVQPDLLCEQTDEDLTARAESVLDIMIDVNLTGKRFLDFGCGLGYMARQALARVVPPIESVGYDPVRQGWERFRGVPNLRLTDDLDSLPSGSFDVILAFDVLDHCDRPTETLTHIRRLLSPQGVVYVRCHPWCSRTGGHLYKQINKAYIHLAVDDDILRRLGYEVEPIKKVLRPLKTYKEWFEVAGLRVLRENVTNEVMEKHLRESAVAKIALQRHWDDERNKDSSLDELKINQIMEIHFYDAILRAI